MKAASARYACIYAREFPAQALLRLRPELHQSPCVVMQGEAPAQSVCSLNARARQLGMTRGMTRIEVETFDAPVVLARSRKMESAAKAILLECAGAFSPLIEDRSEDTALVCGIDILGTGSLFGPPALLARSLLQNLQALGFSARVTISCNLHAAIALAKGMGRGAAVQVIAEGEEAARLAELPLSILDMTEIQAETFSSWGIHTLGMLAALPEKELVSRMGQQAVHLRQLAVGELPHLFQPIELPLLLEEGMELDTPIELLDTLLFVVSVLLDQLILRAKARVLALASITIALRLDGAATHIRTIRPALPTTDKQLWIKLIHLDLEAHPAGQAIVEVSLQAEPGIAGKVQLGLFTPQLPEPSRLDVTLARIRSIVGEENVGRAVLRDSHAADAFGLEPFTVPAADSSVRAVSHPRSMLRQLRPAETAAVTLKNARPAMFFFRKKQYAVESAYGPWLAGGAWWNQSLWGVQQWDLVARAQDGPALFCCLVRDLMQDKWHMTALYD